MALLALILLSLPISSVSSARIAGFIAFGGSHYISMNNILAELVSRGHQVEQTILFFRTLFLQPIHVQIQFGVAKLKGH